MACYVLRSITAAIMMCICETRPAIMDRMRDFLSRDSFDELSRELRLKFLIYMAEKLGINSLLTFASIVPIQMITAK